MQQLPEPYQSLFEAILWDCGAEAVPNLVLKGIDLGYCDPNTGQTPLYAATMANRARTVQALLENGADPNQRFTYRSPVDRRIEADRVALHYAYSTEVAAALIKAGGDVNAADAAGTTPLMCAAFRGPSAVVRLLLANGASPSTRQLKRRGRKPRTARELAESKVELFRELNSMGNNDAMEKRIICYKEICDILLEAEKGIAAQ